MKGEIFRFDASLPNNVDLINVSIKDLSSDDIIVDLFKHANPHGGLRTSNEGIDRTAFLFNLLSLQSPIICYRYHKRYKILTGWFTLTKLSCAIAQHQLPEDSSVLVFVLKKKPSAAVRRGIVLFDLTNDLLSKCFVSDTKKSVSIYDHGLVKTKGNEVFTNLKNGSPTSPH